MNESFVLIKKENETNYAPRELNKIEILGIEMFMTELLNMDNYDDFRKNTYYEDNMIWTTDTFYLLPPFNNLPPELENWHLDSLFIHGTDAIVAIIAHPTEKNNKRYVSLGN